MVGLLTALSGADAGRHQQSCRPGSRQDGGQHPQTAGLDQNRAAPSTSDQATFL